MSWPSDPSEDTHYLDQVIERTQAAVRDLRRAERLIAEVEGAGEAAQGMIRARAGGHGAMRGLHIDPRALRLDPRTLGAEVTKAIQQAQEAATERTQEIVAEATARVGVLPEPLDETFVRHRVESAARDLYSGGL
ncbi:YbaB/EbfC family nucleoid-associated protein [Nonomuraea ferruginea]|uniref:YbaB/EbfC family nucleoid-associated protein n=1 Tax=Nonomuraea ferruginea TaxID=46174 RepID=A0ABT4TAJ5_9ACTN|nr:YbaB/EbfC family nucleoid-associated protein [Nonomuraea ferruginea]MDA0646294.1 YbaB/EbfC family nucleoid-associated protein [Nonomuraea ferruginea]